MLFEFLLADADVDYYQSKATLTYLTENLFGDILSIEVYYRRN
jgi:hypothetical protein